LADELGAESTALAHPDLMQVHANGDVSYSAYEGGAYRRTPLVYAKYTGTYKYSDIESHSMFASHMSPRKALEEFPEEARQALIDEIDGILKMEVWTGVVKSALTERQWERILRSSCFLRQKIDLNGKFIKMKARLVADGRGEDRSLFKEADIASPTVSVASLLTVSTVAAAQRRKVVTMDVGQAYLNANMKEEVLMRLDRTIAGILIERDPSYAKFLDPRTGEIIVRLNKALYGCVESAKLWYDTLAAKFISMGYSVNPYDACVFQKETNEGVITVCVYVDDIFATSASDSMLEELISELEREYKSITVHRGSRHEYLGMLFEFNDDGTVYVSMEQYTRDVLKECGITTTKAEPATAALFVIDATSPVLNKKDSKQFHRNVAQLLYMATRTRPDIILPIIFLTTRVRTPTEQDRLKLRRVLAYLAGTTELGIKLGADAKGQLNIIAYCDASYGVHADMKSHSGIYISAGRGPIVAKSCKQKIVTKSSTEAELVTASDASSLIAYQLNFLQSLGLEFQPAILYQDNMSTMRLIDNGRSNSDRTKHIKLRYFFIKQYVDSGEFSVTYCPTEAMVADILTKPLHGEQFLKLRALLLGHELP